MVDAQNILRLADDVALKVSPRRIILFGSYAYGTPTVDSDVDLLVLMDYCGSSHHQATRIRQLLDVDFPMDLLVRSEPEVERRIGWNDFFLKEIMEKGIVLYAADDARVGAKGRRRLRRRLAAAAVAQAHAV
ncbi:MAG: nucleotidyltransferase domain-containing protein [Tepidisphaeraceae bacterium]